jgi:hypothetical protein
MDSPEKYCHEHHIGESGKHPYHVIDDDWKGWKNHSHPVPSKPTSNSIFASMVMALPQHQQRKIIETSFQSYLEMKNRPKQVLQHEGH